MARIAAIWRKFLYRALLAAARIYGWSARSSA
jgi:hypothetical protein